MTPFDPQRHHRRSIRLKGYDYTQAGVYFVTICTQARECLFGDVVNDQMRLNDAGQMVESAWLDLPQRFPNVELDEFVIMPNHMHGIILIAVGAGLVPAPNGATTATIDRATTRVAPTTTPDVGAGLVPALDEATTGRATTRVAPTTTPDAGAGLVPALDEATTDRATTRVAPTSPPNVGAGLVPALGATTRVAPTRLGDIVGAYKSITTHEYIVGVRERGWPPFEGKVWQRNYYEHIVRNERELDAIRPYIRNNPLQWALDRDNPAHPHFRSAPDQVERYLREAGV